MNTPVVLISIMLLVAGLVCVWWCLRQTPLEPFLGERGSPSYGWDEPMKGGHGGTPSPQPMKGEQEGTLSPLTDDISRGNPISMSGRPNPYVDRSRSNQKGTPDSVVYQAHGIPLIHEDHPTTPVDQSMFYFANHSCRPECCTYSSDSCSNGCVCWEAPPQLSVAQNSNLTPRS
jgi:hypothetical protein